MSDKKLWEQYVALEKERDALRSLVVMRFDHDHPPQFTQGYDTHELTEPVTAEHCRWFVAEIERLSAEVAHIKEVEFPRKAQAVADGWRGKCERLEAKIEAMERQEPECEVVGQVRNVLYEVRTLKYDLPAGTKLYALPGAHPTPSEETRLVSYCPDGNTCTLNINGVEMYYDRVDRDASSAPSVSDDWRQHAARMAALARKLREPDWHFESIREMQRELCALEDAALAAAPEARQ